MQQYQLRPPDKVNAAAFLALAAALGSFALSFLGHGLAGLFGALIGMGAGAIGLILAAAPGKRGAILSLIAIGASVLDLVPAIAAMAGKIKSF